MVDDVLKELSSAMDKAIEAFKRDMAKVRTGRANIAMLDGVKVEYYGTPTPLNQVATLNVPDPRLITIKPWEKQLISDGEMVRVPIPPLTQERRKDLVKMLKKLAEEAKVALRSSRRESNEMLKELTSGGDISEDDERVGLKKVQDLTDKYTAIVDDLLAKKEKEVMDV